MNTLFDYLAVAFLFLFPSLVVVIFGRAFRGLAMTSVHVCHWYASEFSTGRWETLCAARTFKQGLSWRRPYLWFMPRWFLSDQSTYLPTVSYKDFDEAKDYWDERWSIGDKPYLLVRKPDHSVRNVLLALDILLIVLLAGALWLNFHPGAFVSAQSTVTPAPTAEYATPRPTPTGPTMEPLPTATPVQIEVDEESIIIDLTDRPNSTNELIEWLNEQLSVVPIPTLPFDVPLPEWLIELFGFGDSAVIVMPGQGQMLVTHVSVNGEHYMMFTWFEIGNDGLSRTPLAQTGLIKGRKATLTAGDYVWGLEYSPGNSIGHRWSVGSNAKGNVVIFATNLNPRSGHEINIEPVGLAYNFRWWHLLILALVVIVGIVAYRKSNY